MKIADFEKVSRPQFAKDLKNLCELDDAYYDTINLPVRATKGSAGYDFCCPFEVTLRPDETIKIPTGIRCRIDEGYVLQIYPRSSFGFKYQMALLNTVGIIDSDYYEADNEGHIIIAVANHGNKDMVIKQGERFAQGLFVRYYLADEDEVKTNRHGGFGSTN
ncbi:MAG: dUTP diphosphatase [Erysipelotrichaceae bacterium]|nr:dUTP diphosphatase [Erysipelotrichaceae bacterium]